MYYAYFALCNDGTFYAGYTNDLESREAQHNEGKGARYTRARLPVKIVYFEKFQEKAQAMKREYEFKRFTRQQKEDLINI